MKSEVIPFNRVDELGYKAPPQAVIDRFVTALGNCGFLSWCGSARDEVSAACGH